MRAALHAEWTKQRSVASTWWSLGATLVATIGGGAAMTALVHADMGVDVARLAVSGALPGQAIVTVFGASAIGDEYRNGLILVTLAAVPRRDFLLAAKGMVLTGALLATVVLATSTNLVAAALISPDAPEPGLNTVVHAVLGTAVYLALVALFALGVATVSRSTATATGLTLGLLYLPPLLAALLGDPAWQLRVERFAPMSAGLAPPIGGGAGRHHLASWGGLGVVAVWAAVALLAGRQSLRRQDV